MPISINKETDLASYQTLNKSDKYTYKYGLSFWVYINAENKNASFEKYTTIIDYGGKPSVLYNASLNKLIVTMPVNDTIKNNNFFKLDDNGNAIVFEKSNILLQKWNNIILNYNGGTLDIFYNSELVKSVYGFVPYMSYDTLKVGAEKGIHGEICNINYYSYDLGINKINYLYNSVKDKTPPVYNIDETTIRNIKSINTNIQGLFNTVEDIYKKLDKKVDKKINEYAADSHSIIPNKNPQTEYLSLKWFFAQNNDIYN
jgi:hypothetical protein